jgi:D-aminopeptidase
MSPPKQSQPPDMRSILTLMLTLATAISAADPRARELGVPFDGEPGPLNAITDVVGVTVGQVTLIEDLDGGKKVRTGVTAILPRGRESLNLHAFGAWFALNGAGELTGTTWLEESGELEGPVLLTNTHSVGVVHDAAIAWRVHQGEPDATGYWWPSAVVGETWDGHLNDINGFHVRPEHVEQALEKAAAGPVEEGNVGAGTGTICYEFKCGIGTASRSVTLDGREHIVGVLVQANGGLRDSLLIAGAPIGRHLREDRVYSMDDPAASETGSFIFVIATDAPLLPHQLKRIAKRAALGLARMGSTSDNDSGDIFIAFSTANAAPLRGAPLALAEFMPNSQLNALFRATVQATEEAIVNAIMAARDMKGTRGHYAKALPHADLVALLEHYSRLVK